MKKNFIVMLLVLLSSNLFAGPHRNSLILTVSDISKVGQYAKDEAVVTAKQAKRMMEKNIDIVVFDVRKPLLFATGHIPDALNIWRTDITSEKGSYDFEGMRISKEKIKKLLSDHGVRTHTKILIYDANANYDSARLWWILTLYGHTNITLIDGGIQGWKSSKLPIEYGFGREPYKGNYIFVRRNNKSKYTDLREVKATVSNRRGVILDTRTKPEYVGIVTKKGAYRAGRIPHSELIPWGSSVYLDKNEQSYSKDYKNIFKKFKTIKELEKIYGKYKNKHIKVYSQSGIGSAHTTFVLTQLLGYRNVKNYDGSWIEWSYHKGLKVEKN